jgi:hypothetical protein
MKSSNLKDEKLERRKKNVSYMHIITMTGIGELGTTLGISSQRASVASYSECCS